MPNIRPISEDGMTHEEYMTAIYYCRQYKQWHEEITQITITKSPVLTGMPGSHSNTSRTEEVAIRLVELKTKIRNVEEAALDAVNGNRIMYKYIMRCVTNKGITYKMLKQQGMPCGASMFYKARRKFYKNICKKI